MKGKQSEWSVMVKCLCVKLFLLEYSLGLGFFYYGGWIGGFERGNGLRQVMNG